MWGLINVRILKAFFVSWPAPSGYECLRECRVCLCGKNIGSFVKKLKRKNIITDAEALRKDYPQISPMTEIKSLKTKL